MVLLIADGAFRFHCMDVSRNAAMRRLRKAFNAHLRQGKFALMPVEDCLTVNFIEDFTQGVVYRDYEPCAS